MPELHDDGLNAFRMASLSYMEHILECKTCMPEGGLPEGAPLCEKGQELWDAVELEEADLKGKGVIA